MTVQLTPKFHTELAGEGVEYSWAHAKGYYRCVPNSSKRGRENIKDLVKKCTSPVKVLNFYDNTHFLLNIYNNTVYCQPCLHFADPLVHRFVPIIKNEDFTLVFMAIISFLSSSKISPWFSWPLSHSFHHQQLQTRVSMCLCNS